MKSVSKNTFAELFLSILFIFVALSQFNLMSPNYNNSNRTSQIDTCISTPVNIVFVSNRFNRKQDVNDDSQYNSAFWSGNRYLEHISSKGYFKIDFLENRSNIYFTSPFFPRGPPAKFAPWLLNNMPF